MVPPEGFDLPISRIEEGADAGRGNARTQPRARDCRVPPSRFADADFRETTPRKEKRKKNYETLLRDARDGGPTRRVGGIEKGSGHGYAVTHAHPLGSLVAGFARVARVSSQPPTLALSRLNARTSDVSHAVVQQVVRQVPHARVAVPALDVLVVRPDDDARRGFAHEQTDVALS